MSVSRASARPSITIVSDLPEPCVCQITPPLRVPSRSSCLTRSTALADPEELLVARDLAHAAVEHGEAADDVEQPLGTAQGVDQSGPAR